jgi:hypothetical protein
VVCRARAAGRGAACEACTKKKVGCSLTTTTTTTTATTTSTTSTSARGSSGVPSLSDSTTQELARAFSRMTDVLSQSEARSVARDQANLDATLKLTAAVERLSAQLPPAIAGPSGETTAMITGHESPRFQVVTEDDVNMAEGDRTLRAQEDDEAELMPAPQPSSGSGSVGGE